MARIDKTEPRIITAGRERRRLDLYLKTKFGGRLISYNVGELNRLRDST